MVSNNTDSNDVLGKLNRLEDQAAKLTAQIKSNKQTINELKLVISQQDKQIHELELKLGYAQQSLLEKTVIKIQQCRVQIKTGMDEKVINPAVTQIQQQLKTAQQFVDETRKILLEKKALVDNAILLTKDKIVKSPAKAKNYVEASIISPAQAKLNQTLETISIQTNTTQTLVEDKAIYPSKMLFNEIMYITKTLPDKIFNFIETQVIAPLNQANKKTTSVTKNIYPEALNYISNTIAQFGDTYNHALTEIIAQVKKSPFWDGKYKTNVS